LLCLLWIATAGYSLSTDTAPTKALAPLDLPSPVATAAATTGTKRAIAVPTPARTTPLARIPSPTPTPMPKPHGPITLGATCVTAECHSKVGGEKFVHGPVNLNQCEPCHIAVDKKHDFSKDPKGRAVCLTCHDVEKPKAVVHKPFGLDCTLCHNPHGGDNRYFVKGGTGVDGCIRCHTDVRAGLKFLHGPLAEGNCAACHSPHQSDNAKLLVDPPDSLCTACHVDFTDKMKNAVSVHDPARKNCSGCHSPHGGANKFMLRAEGEDLCAGCHQPFLAKIKSFNHPHMPMIEGKTCPNCHEPHSSMQQKLLKKDTSDLCLSCHNQPVQTKSRLIRNVAGQIGESKYLHGPLRQKNCVACHEGHGSDFPYILNKAYPDKFYASFTPTAYDLCFECHDKKIALQEKSTDTGFRNGEVNLHFLHVNREKGRTCRACHQEHAANQPKDIRDEVPFGRWSMKVQYTKTDTGGGCSTGCHSEYKYDRDHPVKNAVERKSQPVGE
jgi:predicted CXXCH cytochrome family protein